MPNRSLGFVAAGLLCAPALAQPFNVRAWYAEGQVFVVWQFPAPPAVATDTVEIYSSAGVQANTANMTRIGRLFYPEYTGARLQELVAGATLRVPTPGGGIYTLAADEGVFAYTPRAAGGQFFAVVDTGSTIVVPANSEGANFNYDPVTDPVRPHPQFVGTTPGGYPYTAYVVWAEGIADYDNPRPDIPVLANENKNGVPHVFTITKPLPGNPPPTEPIPCLFALHGGQGEYELFRPGIPARANLSLPLTNGIVVSPDDSVYTNVEGTLLRSNTSWFGYVSNFDPFDAGVRADPPDGSVVVNYTQRRVYWIMDWLIQNNQPFPVDPNRVAMIGHSGGGRGTSHLTRVEPARFCAAVCYTPASDLSQDDAGRVNYLRGNWDQNLSTNLHQPSDENSFLGVTDVFTMTTRLSPTQRDLAPTRYYYGKRDEEGAASWSTAQRAVVDSLDASRLGFMISWDEREHGVEKWDDETNDATDGHAGPWPEIGQWIAPVRSLRPSAQYLLDTYRADQSYPGFFNADHDPLLAGRQPDPGPGDPDLGDPWGTWTGYFEWDTATLVDTAHAWECTVYAVGLSTASIDNSPVAEIATDLIPRRVKSFLPSQGTPITWEAIDVATSTVVQSGSTTAEADSVVAITGLIVPRDPDRIRLTVRVTCPPDFNNDGFLTGDDFDQYVIAFEAGDAAADYNNDSFVTGDDFDAFVAAFEAGC